MRVTIAATDLHEALRQSALAASTTLPVLTHARLATTADNQHVVVEATDLVARTIITIPSAVDRGGGILVDGRKLLAVAAGGGDLAIDDTGTVRRGRSRFSLPVMPALDFPEAEPAEFVDMGISPAALAAAIEQVQYAPNPNDARPICQGVSISRHGVFGTNGHALGAVQLRYDGPDMIIPHAALKYLQGLLHEGSTVSVSASGRQAQKLRVEAGNTVVELLLIAAQPADIGPLAGPPYVEERRVLLKRKPFLAALRNFTPFVAVYGNNKVDRGVVLVMRDGQLFLADAPDNAANQDDVSSAVDTAAGGDFEVGISINYLQAILGSIDTDLVDWRPDADSRNVLFPVVEGKPDAIHVVMPQRLSVMAARR